MIRKWLFKLLFERLPIIKLLNGKKRLIGNILLFSGLILEGLLRYFPEIPHISEFNSQWVIMVGALMDLIGDAHAKVKKES